MGYISWTECAKAAGIMDTNTDIDGIVFELIKRCKAEPMSRNQ